MKSVTLEAAACRPKDRWGLARDGRQIRAGRNRAALVTHAALISHRNNCWTTRLQAPKPAMAAAMAAMADTALAQISPAANTENRRSRMMRALATDRLPDTTSSNDRAIRIGGRPGSPSIRAAGQARAQITRVSRAHTPTDSQNTVDSSSRDGSRARTRALPRPASETMLASRRKGM